MMKQEEQSLKYYVNHLNDEVKTLKNGMCGLGITCLLLTGMVIALFTHVFIIG